MDHGKKLSETEVEMDENQAEKIINETNKHIDDTFSQLNKQFEKINDIFNSVEFTGQGDCTVKTEVYTFNDTGGFFDFVKKCIEQIKKLLKK